MDWNKIIKFAKAQGYTGGDADAPAVKSFLAAKLITLSDGTKDIDVEAAYKSHAEAARATRVVLGDDETDSLKAQLAESQAATKAAKDAARKAASAAVLGGAADDDDAPQRFTIGNHARKAFQARANAGETYVKDADSAELIGAWAKAVALSKAGDTASKSFKDAAEICRKANVSYDLSSGGFGIPEILRNQVIEIRGAYEALTELGVSIEPIPAQGTTVPRITGGVTVYSPGQGVAATESNIAGDQVRLQPFEMVALSTVTNQTLQSNNFDFGSKVAERMRYAMMKKLEEIYFNGDGTSTYFNQRGVLGKFTQLVTDAGGTWTTNAEYAAGMVRASSAAWSGITYTDIQGVMAAIGALEGIGGVKLVSSWQFYQSVLVPLAQSKGGVTGLEVVNGIPRSWMGNPLVISNALPQRSAASTVCLYAGDFALGTKIGVAPDTMSLSTSTERYWDQRKVGYQMALNYAINVHDVGNANATAASREYGPVAGLITTA